MTNNILSRRSRAAQTLCHGALLALCCCFGLMVAGTVQAQPAKQAATTAPLIPRGGFLAQLAPPTSGRPQSLLLLSAFLSATDTQPLRSGLIWRVYDERAEADGSHKLVAQSTKPTPSLSLPDGTYIVHAALGLAGMTKRVTMEGQPMSARLVLNAGGLRIVGMLGNKPINPAKLSISIYVPEPGNSEAKLVLANAKSGAIIGLPEGAYHVVSTLLDTTGTGSLTQGGISNATNSVIHADLHVQAGKLTDATLRHRAAVITLKLVNAPGSEALANTTFTILTPGGDVIRELIGAFPSLVLAAGEYVAIARHDNKTYQTDFKVQSTRDHDVEVLAK
ncbi:hypothetical protein [Methylovirgula sp. HY1]|uniref:hypothetical protein n=1 Tax=Methylovirgula sp. HY1 TaxID=2822761 RepID=UPI001C7431B7|nr:hypothetical protein [Methylovirgula sp. HY1]QXX74034.1 hypothetical protein MHY1_00840 [Methylovirgula sp. HY1]